MRTESIARRISPFAPEKEWGQRVNSPANERIHRIITLLEQVEHEAETWLKEHGDECTCPYCSHGAFGRDAARHLAGVAWIARTAADTIHCDGEMGPKIFTASHEAFITELPDVIADAPRVAAAS